MIRLLLDTVTASRFDGANQVRTISDIFPNNEAWREADQVERRQFLRASIGTGAAMSVASMVNADAIPADAGKKGATPPPSDRIARAETGDVDITPPGDHSQTVIDPGSDFMVDVLKAAGIKYVAAMAGSSFRGLHESILNYAGNKAPELIVVTHEETSAAFAHGYAKVAGEPMACMVHSNVGLQHASMAVYNAWCDRAPIIVIAGNVLDAARRRSGVEWLHTGSDIGTIVRDYVKWDDAPASLQHFADSFMRAREMAMTPPYAPVMIVADSDLQEDPIRSRAALTIPRRAPVSAPAGDRAALDATAALLVDAQNPVIVVDRVARSQAGVDLLVRLAELLNCPVVDRFGRMNMPTNHYLCQSARQRELVAAADVIVAMELTDLYGVMNSIVDAAEKTVRRVARADAKTVAISASYAFMHSNVQDVQRYFPADITIAADAQAALPLLIECVEVRLTAKHRRRIAARTADLKRAFAAMRAADAEAAAIGWDASPISTARLCMTVWDKIRDLEWGLVSNPYFASSWHQRLWDITKYHQFIGGEGGYGVGYIAPASAGAALAHRDAGRIAVSIQTDGDLMMLPGSLWTMAYHKLPLLMVMHNNRAWHQETMHLQRMTNRRDRDPERWRIGTVIENPNIDFATMAKSMGVWAEGPITDPTKLSGAVDRALAVVKSGAPALLDVVTQMR